MASSEGCVSDGTANYSSQCCVPPSTICDTAGKPSESGVLECELDSVSNNKDESIRCETPLSVSTSAQLFCATALQQTVPQSSSQHEPTLSLPVHTSVTSDPAKPPEQLSCSADLSNSASSDAGSKSCLQLAAAYLNSYRPALQDTRQRLDEVVTEQRRLISAVQLENGRFRECSYTYNVPDMLQQLSVYRDKLEKVQRTMTSVHARCGRLKVRAARLLSSVKTKAEKRQISQRRLVARFAGASARSQPSPPN